jgi:hypothetical protein
MKLCIEEFWSRNGLIIVHVSASLTATLRTGVTLSFAQETFVFG